MVSKPKGLKQTLRVSSNPGFFSAIFSLSEIRSSRCSTMAETICRALRDGAFEGEHAPALTIKDTIDTPLGSFVFNHILTQLTSNVLAGKSQARGVVLVALSRPPSFYAELLKSKGFDISSSSKWLRVLDCYSDPLGWKKKLMERGTVRNPYEETLLKTSLCKNVKELDKVLSSIVELGKEIVEEGKGRFAVAIDSVSEILRHSSLPSVAKIFSHLRSHDQVSCMFCLLHVDLHEAKVAATLEYLSTMHADVEPIVQRTNGQRNTSDDLPVVEQCFKRGKFHVRFKRRNGRVRVMREELYIEGSGIKFAEVSSEDGIIAQSLVPKVQFNLDLSEKERLDRAKVVLPFEHQGTGKPIQIYDGRKSLNESETEEKQASVDQPQTTEDSGRGEIIYFRDSDDEMPDSDEDPDDDLDI